MDTETFRLGVVDAAKALAAGSLRARELAEAQLARVAATDPAVRAWAHLDAQQVRSQADACDAQPAANRGPLFGLGIGVKDIIATADQPTQMGCAVYDGHRPDEDAAVVARLRGCGGYVFGKAVTTALAFLDPGKTTNPWNPRHTPGGSSSGPAAAVAAGQVAAAIGTQTNGSVIRPAAYCGVVGFKPTKDAIAFAGVHVFSDTLDQLGTFTRDVGDAAYLASGLSTGARLADTPATLPKPPRLAYLEGFPWTLDADRDAAASLDAVVSTLRRAGADVSAVAFPAPWREAHRVHRTIMLHEAARHLAPLQARERSRLSPKLNAAIDEGRSIASGDYEAAMHRRHAAIAFFADWLSGYDAIVAPPAPGPAPEGLDTTGDPSCCTLWSLLGFPALALPTGRARNGLPLGLQIAAPAGEDDRLLAVAAWCEASVPFKGLV